ncbi:MAG: DNA repair protein RecN [Saccharofermentans sp.]|nr:DNA repair protein RecN [Saccharofermentans sp.]
MLIRLEIKDFAVISNIAFEPSYGLNVISGETGAGKSLIVDAISLILGAKASKNLIRTSSPSCFVEACFDIADLKDEELNGILTEADIEPDDGMLYISRTIYQNGKSLARINGRTVTLSVLKQIASFLVDIHGQHDTQKIFDEKSHVAFLDSFAGEEVTRLHSSYKAKLAEYKDVVTRIREISKSPDYLDKRKEYLEYVISEIDEAGFKDGDEEKLYEKRQKLLDAEKSAAGLSETSELLSGSEYSNPVRQILQASKTLSEVASKDKQYEGIAQTLQSLSLDLESVESDLNKILDDLDYDPEIKSGIEQKIGVLFDLKAKYGSTISEINAFRDSSKEELDSIDSNKDLLSDLRKKSKQIEKDLIDVASALSSARHKAATRLSSEIVRELSDLEMPNSIFEVSFTEHEKSRYFSSAGTEDIAFRFSANPGQEVRPLSAIVSGGEASRIMLAVKNILSRCDLTPTLIFDEIDTGVSGKASEAIARKLMSISTEHQVLCVTHTAQIAAAADCNFLLSKKIEGGNTITVCDVLDNESKTTEVSRLLSGSDKDSSIRLATDLIESFGK